MKACKECNQIHMFDNDGSCLCRIFYMKVVNDKQKTIMDWSKITLPVYKITNKKSIADDFAVFSNSRIENMFLNPDQDDDFYVECWFKKSVESDEIVCKIGCDIEVFKGIEVITDIIYGEKNE